MQMTRSPTLQLKKPASIICEAEGDDRCGQLENPRFRTCLRLSTSVKVFSSEFITVVSVFSRFAECSSLTSAEDRLTDLFTVGVMRFEGGIFDNTNGHEGLRCLCIENGCMSDFKPDISSLHIGQCATSPLSAYSNPAESIAL